MVCGARWGRFVSDNWYVSDERRQVGPLDLKTLQATLANYPDAGDLLVWHDGLAEWKRARDVPELGAMFSAPLPLPRHEPEPRKPDERTDLKTEGALRPPRFNNFIARHWRGECPLWLSYWIFYVLGGVCLGVILLVIDWKVSGSADYAPHIAFSTLIGTWLAILTLAVWQFVGVWRSAERRIRERLRLGKRATWATLAKVVVVLGVAELVFRFAFSGLPPIMEATRITFMDDPALPPYAIRMMRNGTEMEIAGGFKYGLTDDVRRILDASPQMKVVHLDSRGGRIGEARKLNALIRERGLITYVVSRCESACTFAFAAGRERWLHADGVLGFHAPAVPGLSDADLADRVNKQKAIFAAAGIDPRFIDRALATPNETMWRPSVDELLGAKVITAISDGSRFAASGYGVHTSQEGLASSVTTLLPILQAMRERRPKDYAELIDIYYSGYVNGQTEIEISNAARAKLFDIVIASRSLADDAVLVDWAKLVAEQYAALGAKDPSLCYAYATAARTRNFLPELPNDLMDRQFVLEERIIATAATRPEVTAAMLAPVRTKVQEQLVRREPLKMRLLLFTGPINPSQHGDYCDASVAMLEVVTGLPQGEAALFLRYVFGGK
jgi:hypothetical protein